LKYTDEERAFIEILSQPTDKEALRKKLKDAISEEFNKSDKDIDCDFISESVRCLHDIDGKELPIGDPDKMFRDIDSKMKKRGRLLRIVIPLVIIFIAAVIFVIIKYVI
jgi:hypothetical protein